MKVRELLSDESKWTQRAFARDASGKITILEADDAVCFCLNGAIQRCYPVGFADVIERVSKRVRKPSHYWNDAPERTYAEVMAVVNELGI